MYFFLLRAPERVSVVIKHTARARTQSAITTTVIIHILYHMRTLTNNHYLGSYRTVKCNKTRVYLSSTPVELATAVRQIFAFPKRALRDQNVSHDVQRNVRARRKDFSARQFIHSSRWFLKNGFC